MVWEWQTTMPRDGSNAGTARDRIAAEAVERSQQRAVPRWMAWAPPAALVWALAYGSVRVWWAVAGAPSFGPLGTDLIGFTGWWAVGLCAAAAVVTLGLWAAPWRSPLLVAAWGVSAALVVACPLLLLDVVGRLLPGLGLPFHPVAFLSRGACLAGGVLVGAAAVAYRRRWRSACLSCGRTNTSRRPARPPRWAWWAAYVAVGGWLVRLLAQLAVGLDRSPLQEGGSLLLFEVGFVLAGTVLPLALVHPWGRVFPRWVPLVAGRRVPGWLLLGPAFAIAGGLTIYFGVGTAQLTVETLRGTWDQSANALPLAFFWVAMPAYLVWGLGLGAAALAYRRATRPPCRVCGR
jgi:hypothetical protein